MPSSQGILRMAQLTDCFTMFMRQEMQRPVSSTLTSSFAASSHSLAKVNEEWGTSFSAALQSVGEVSDTKHRVLIFTGWQYVLTHMPH